MCSGHPLVTAIDVTSQSSTEPGDGDNVGMPQSVTLTTEPMPTTWIWPDTVILVAATLLVAIVVRLVVHRTIDKVVRASIRRVEERDRIVGGRAGRVLAEATGFGHERQRQRTATIGSLLKSVTSFVVWTVALLMVLSLLGLPLAPLLASAGVGGVALGFGAQSLVKDFLSGIFMMVEDQYGVGDLVDTGEVTGTVEEVSLRVTRLRDPTGVVWYVRNGEIVRVANKSQGWSTAVVDVPVAYDEDAQKVIDVLTEALAPMRTEEQWQPLLLEDPQVLGVETVAGGTMTVRVMAKCAPNEHFAVQRGILERGKEALDRAGVRGPLPVYGVRTPEGAGQATGATATNPTEKAGE